MTAVTGRSSCHCLPETCLNVGISNIYGYLCSDLYNWSLQLSCMALNLDGWVLLCLECCLLYAICMTGHYSFHWLKPGKLLGWGVIPLFVVLLVVTICVTGCCSCHWVGPEIAQTGCHYTICCTACSVCLCLSRLDVPVIIARLGLFYGWYDQFSWFSACFCLK